MRKVFIILFLFISLCGLSQKITAINERDHTKAYVGVDNPISYTAENNSCKAIYPKATKGMIAETLPCRFNYRANAPGSDTITIYKKNTDGELRNANPLEFGIIEPRIN